MADPPSYDDVLQANQVSASKDEATTHLDVRLDTKVTITDPVTQKGGGQAFTSYKVTTRTSNPKYRAASTGDAVVMRRFSEFHWLYNKLRQEFPGVVVPPCPEKNTVEKFRKSPAFVEARRQALEIFMNKVCSHHLLKHSDTLMLFLEADEAKWNHEFSRLRAEQSDSSFVGRVTQMASDLVYSTKNLAKGASDDKGEDVEYLQYKEYATHLDHHLKDTCGRAADFVTRQAAYGESLAAFGAQAAQMSKFEEGPAAQAFMELEGAVKRVAGLHSDINGHVNRVFAAPLKEQHAAIKSLKETMQDRSTALGHQTQTRATVDACKSRLAQMRHSNAKPESIRQAEMRLEEAEGAARKAEEMYKLIQERMKHELLLFQRQRSDAMALALKDFALAQAKLAKQSANCWRGLMDRMGTFEGAQGSGLPAASG